MGTRLIKKYSNRRLYDTSDSQYITLEQLEERIVDGAEVSVVDAQTGEDLTQITLLQVIEKNGASRLLPVPLLTQLIRMRDDDALAEFIGRYVASALELYQHGKHGAQAISPFNPLASLPFQATSALARLLLPAAPPALPPPSHEIDQLQRQIDELRRDLAPARAKARLLRKKS